MNLLFLKIRHALLLKLKLSGYRKFGRQAAHCLPYRVAFFICVGLSDSGTTCVQAKG